MMKIQLEPTDDNIIATPDYIEKTKSGLFIPDNAAKESPKIGTIVAIGPDVKKFKIGQKILYRHALEQTLPDNIKVIITDQEQVLAIVRHEKE